jgi:hypothetical protein
MFCQWTQMITERETFDSYLRNCAMLWCNIQYFGGMYLKITGKVCWAIAQAEWHITTGLILISVGYPSVRGYG